MEITSAEDFDLIVLGGGPGGSTLAAFTAMQGHRVLLLEREQFPRHQIGESLLPATVHGICRLLGIQDELKSQNFPVKRGGTFLWGKKQTPWTFTFSNSPNSPTGTAYQVERMKFDTILLNNARSKGVDVREQHMATRLLIDKNRVAGVGYTDASGRELTATARYVVDAGGNGSNFHKHCGERVFSRFFQNVALYCYYENGKRLPPPDSGNILSVAFKDGWFWYIPLSATLTSVGAVVSREAAEKIQSGPEHAMLGFIDQAPMIKEYLSGATRVKSGPYGRYRVRKDYSYCNARFWKLGLALIGDAACFIDPVFSSGVHLSTYSALLAARSINTCLQSNLISEEASFEEFERRYRREFGNFYQFLVGFYDMQVDEESYFWRARKIVATDERENVAFVRLVAGLSAIDEPIFGEGREFFENRNGFGEWFERAVQEGTEPKPKPRSSEPKSGGGEFDGSRFMEGFASEITQIQLQALFGKDRDPEQPLFTSNLVPSPDGLHWMVANQKKAATLR
jgi:halogenation protein CepH